MSKGRVKEAPETIGVKDLGQEVQDSEDLQGDSSNEDDVWNRHP